MFRPRDPKLLADEDLMELVRGRDADAFEVIYDRHADAAYSLAFRMLGARSAAEEVVQDAFLVLWRNSASYRAERGSVRTWLLGVVHHRAVDALRRQLVHQRRRAADVTAAERRPAQEHTDVEVARREEAREVRSALDALPPDQSRVIELAYFGGYTHSEIAEMLDLPLGTVKGRMRLALSKLRGDLAGVAP